MASLRSYLDLEAEYVTLAVPMSYMVCVQYSLCLSTAMFAGQVDEDTLSGVGLSNTMYFVCQYSVMYGFSSVMDTYGPQVFGSSGKHELGHVLIKVLLQGILAWLVLLGPYLNIVYFISYMRPHVDGPDLVLAKAVLFLRITCLLGVMDFSYDVIAKYLLIQGRKRSVYCLSTITLGFHLLYNYLIVIRGGYGVKGLGLACVASRLTGLSITLLYLLYNRYCIGWSGFSWRVFQDWAEMIKLGLSGAVNCFAESIVIQLAVFLSQYISQVAFNTVLILLAYAGVSWACGMGIAYAVSVLLGRALGHQDKVQCVMTMKLAIANAVTIGVTVGVMLYSLRWELPKLFTKDPAVIALTASATWISALTMIFETLQTSLSRGILVGLGKQRFIAVVMAIIAYGAFTPWVFISVFLTDYGPDGIFLGILLFCVLSGVVNGTKLIFFVDLDRELVNSQERVELSTRNDQSPASDHTDLADAGEDYGAIKEGSNDDYKKELALVVRNKLLLFLGALVLTLALGVISSFKKFDTIER